MSPLYLDNEQFIQSFKHVPRLAINLLILNRQNQFLLTRRAIEPEKGKWHLPGCFLLKEEKIDTCLERIATEELGFPISANDCRLADVSENLEQDPRGHIVDVIYKYRLLKAIWLKPWGSSAELAFFNSIPPEMGFNHGQILSKWYNGET